MRVEEGFISFPHNYILLPEIYASQRELMHPKARASVASTNMTL
jgi:hypothetical protein